ncbi:MAG: hypothetical protein ACYDEV_07380 [Acidiferrobacter sp.]
MPHWRTLGAASLAAALVGCVPLTPPRTPTTHGCAVGTAWSTAYAPTHLLGALHADQLHVLSYRMSVAPASGRRCGAFTLTKRLTLLRGAGPLHIVEIRDFYTHGRLVAEHRAFIGHMIPQSGAYKARLTLPIPASAPFGRYRVVSLLYARWGSGPALLVARTQTAFSIAP